MLAVTLIVAAAASAIATPPRSAGLVRVVFTGNGGGRYLDVTRWLHDDTRECYARRTADEKVAVSWRLTWTVPVIATSHGYTLGRPSQLGGAISGSARGASVRDSCDAAEEEPGWAGSDVCQKKLPTKSAGRVDVEATSVGTDLFFRGPIFGGPGKPCELEIRNDQLVAHVPLARAALAAVAEGRSLTLPVGPEHPRPGDDYLGTRNCSAFPHIYDGVVYLYECNDTLTWNGTVSFSSAR